MVTAATGTSLYVRLGYMGRQMSRPAGCVRQFEQLLRSPRTRGWCLSSDLT